MTRSPEEIMKSKWLAAKRKIFYFSDNTLANECNSNSLRRLAMPGGEEK
jgi:hypothetical protein